MADDMEQMQDELVTLREQVKEQAEQLKTLSDSNESLKTSLESARKLNTKLINNTPIAPSVPVAEPEPESLDSFCDSFIKPAITELYRRFGLKE